MSNFPIKYFQKKKREKINPFSQFRDSITLRKKIKILKYIYISEMQWLSVVLILPNALYCSCTNQLTFSKGRRFRSDLTFFFLVVFLFVLFLFFFTFPFFSSAFTPIHIPACSKVTMGRKIVWEPSICHQGKGTVYLWRWQI